jgi:predicted lipoprotein with Yx(FWY)xxD motif
MKRPFLILSLAPIAAALAVAGCGGSGGGSASSGGGAYGSAAPASTPATTPKPASAPAAGGARVAVASGGAGAMLVDAQGRALYLWKADTTDQSTCSGACAAGWPPVTTTGAPQAGTGAKASLLGTTKLADGTTQVTYAGHPLYRFAGDAAAGQINGQGTDGFGAQWWVVSPAGAAITRAAS